MIDGGQDPFGGDVLHDALMFTRRDDSLEYLVLYEDADRRTSIYRAPSDNQILLGERWRVVGVDERGISIGYENRNRRDTVVRLRRPSASER